MCADKLPGVERDADTGEKPDFPLFKGKSFIFFLTFTLTAVLAGGMIFGINAAAGGGIPSQGRLVGGVVEFNVSVRQWSFEPSVIQVKPGDKVRFNITSADLMHGFTINELGVNAGIMPNASITKEITVPSGIKEGVYPVYCSVYCGIGHPYMKGKVIVGNPPMLLGLGVEKVVPFAVSLLAVVLFVSACYLWFKHKGGEKTSKPLDLMRFGTVRRLVMVHPFQFLVTLPVLAVFVVASFSILYGVRMAGMNFGMVLTWVVWWGLLIGMFIVFGRGWCLVCPFGSAGEWLQRASLWWKAKWRLGFDFKYPRRLRNLWLGILAFVVFLFLDAGYGISNNVALTGGLLVTMLLLSAWMGLVYEGRAFCRYVCPLTVFIGVSSMFAPFEIRRKDAALCRACRTQDCFRGNERYHACPTAQFQGAGLDSNRDCVLCTECLKACPSRNVGMNLRMWGRDLWRRKTGRPDEAAAASIIPGLVTVVPFLLIILLPSLRQAFASLLPAGTPPNDWPRLAGISAVYLGGIGITLLLMHGFSRLSKRFSGSGETAGTLFNHFAYALVPLGVMKFLADILDHVLRNWGYLVDAVRGLMLDFPRNRAMVPESGLRELLGTGWIYFLQAALVLIGFAFSLYVALKLAGKLFPEKTAAFRAFLPVGGFILLLALTAIWTLSTVL